MLLLVFVGVLVSSLLLASRLRPPSRATSSELGTMSPQWVVEQRGVRSGLSQDR
jgi:hypothetical protein